MELQSVLS